MATARALHRKVRPDIDASLQTLTELVELCDRFDAVPDLYAARLHRDFDRLVRSFDEVARALDLDDATVLGSRVQAAVMPLMRRTSNGHRWFAKPRGYAGDFLSIARIYDDVAEGTGAVGAMLDRCFLNLPAARAVQNRRRLLGDEIRASLLFNGGSPTRVTSLACGPARELFDLSVLDMPLEATLLDIDEAALAYCAAETVRHGRPMRLVEANLIHVALGRRSLELADQDLVYSIGLIDYLGDALVIKLLDYIHTTLRPGGRVLLGNFHTSNPTKAFMDHVLEWKLIHRSEADMRRLFAASAFGACTRITYEAQRINLFAEGIKS